MRSFFPLLATTLLLCASTASAQISIIGNSNARECYNEAKADRANTEPCDDALAGDMLVGRNLAATYVNRAVVRTNAGRLASERSRTSSAQNRSDPNSARSMRAAATSSSIRAASKRRSRNTTAVLQRV